MNKPVTIALFSFCLMVSTLAQVETATAKVILNCVCEESTPDPIPFAGTWAECEAAKFKTCKPLCVKDIVHDAFCVGSPETKNKEYIKKQLNKDFILHPREERRGLSPTKNPLFLPENPLLVGCHTVKSVVRTLTGPQGKQMAATMLGLTTAVLFAEKLGLRIFTLPYRVLFLTPTIIIQEILNQHSGKWSQSSLDRDHTVRCETTDSKGMACTIPVPSRETIEVEFFQANGETHLCNNG